MKIKYLREKWLIEFSSDSAENGIYGVPTVCLAVSEDGEEG